MDWALIISDGINPSYGISSYLKNHEFKTVIPSNVKVGLITIKHTWSHAKSETCFTISCFLKKCVHFHILDISQFSLMN